MDFIDASFKLVSFFPLNLVVFVEPLYKSQAWESYQIICAIEYEYRQWYSGRVRVVINV